MLILLMITQLIGTDANDSSEKLFNDTKLKKLPSIPPGISSRWPTMMLAAKIKNDMITLHETYRPYCDKSTDGFKSNYKYIYMDSILPDGCSNINICNSTTCVNLEFGSMFFSRVYRRSYGDHLLGLANSQTDSIQTQMCSKLQTVQVTICNDPAFCCKNKLLPFNIPGHR